MNLSLLTRDELLRLDAALTGIDVALEMLETTGAVNAEAGVDLIELSEALAVEVERRALEDADFHVASSMARGEVISIMRPDGLMGYAPVDFDGDVHLYGDI